jgi:hypothetical protein
MLKTFKKEDWSIKEKLGRMCARSYTFPASLSGPNIERSSLDELVKSFR